MYSTPQSCAVLLFVAGSNLLWLNLEDRTIPKGLSIGRDSRTTFIEVEEDFAAVKHYGVRCKLQAIEVQQSSSNVLFIV